MTKPQTVHVALDDRSYDITLAHGALPQTGAITRAAFGPKARRVALISNAKVHGLYGKAVEKSLKQAGFTVLTHLMGDGERAKSIRTAECAWGFLIAHHFERSDGIVALGGGVVGDLAGFVAATFLRGVNFVQLPTTLLAQIDSSVGGKTAVNHALGKNLIGAFHQPRAVLIDPSVLATLPPRELRAGMYEVLKTGLIRDAALAGFINQNLNQLTALDPASLTQVIKRCCEIKAEVVMADEREGGLRRILNFGHTIGHALEAITKYRRLKHGEAVGYGMQCATTMAERAGLLDSSAAATIQASVRALGPLPRINDLDVGEIIAATAHDKKAAQGKIPFILPTRVGEVMVRDDLPSSIVRAAVRELLAKN
ncbi:MAG: 3-dehydroquinate synthase [Acidobacteria bacterium]|nr:3-dehydroquinate synthase [Acidobacteriota bacterium]MBI3426535.1 3-dehydroquinate synthase [Acidobacteriota bacterium]